MQTVSHPSEVPRNILTKLKTNKHLVTTLTFCRAASQISLLLILLPCPARSPRTLLSPHKSCRKPPNCCLTEQIRIELEAEPEGTQSKNEYMRCSLLRSGEKLHNRKLWHILSCYYFEWNAGSQKICVLLDLPLTNFQHGQVILSNFILHATLILTRVHQKVLYSPGALWEMREIKMSVCAMFCSPWCYQNTELWLVSFCIWINLSLKNVYCDVTFLVFLDRWYFFLPVASVD